MSAPVPRSMPTLILTRPRQQADDWLTRLAALGVPALALPLIEIVPAPDVAAVVQSWQALPGAALAMFVSPNAVEQFFAARPEGMAWPAGVLAATVGPGSAQALRAAGVPAALIVQPAADAPSLDSEHLWPQLAHRPWAGRRVLVLRGEGGREWLAEQLRAAGAEVEFVSVYRRRAPQLGEAGRARLAAALAEPTSHVWLFSSAEAIGHLAALAAAQGLTLGGGRCLATHPRIAAAAQAAGFAHVVLTRPDAAAVARALQDGVDADLQ